MQPYSSPKLKTEVSQKVIKRVPTNEDSDLDIVLSMKVIYQYNTWKMQCIDNELK